MPITKSLQDAVAFSATHDLNKYMLATEGSGENTQVLFLEKRTLGYGSWIGRAVIRLFGIHGGKFKAEGLHKASSEMLKYIEANKPQNGSKAARNITGVTICKMRKAHIDPTLAKEIEITRSLTRIAQCYPYQRETESLIETIKMSAPDKEPALKKMSLKDAVAFLQTAGYSSKNYMLATEESPEGTQILFLDKKKARYSTSFDRALARRSGKYDERFQIEGLHQASLKMLDYINANRYTLQDGDKTALQIASFAFEKNRKNPKNPDFSTPLLTHITTHYPASSLTSKFAHILATPRPTAAVSEQPPRQTIQQVKPFTRAITQLPLKDAVQVIGGFRSNYSLDQYMLATEGSGEDTQILFLDKKIAGMHNTWIGRVLLRLFGVYDNKFQEKIKFQEKNHLEAAWKMLEYIDANKPENGIDAAVAIDIATSWGPNKDKASAKKMAEFLAKLSEHYYPSRRA